MSEHATRQDALRYFADCDRCHQLMTELRWPGGKVACPRCKSERVTWLERRRVWKCYTGHVRPTFSLKSGTIFEDSPIALGKWFTAIWMLLDGGASSYEVHRTTGVTQKSAWFLIRRIQLAAKMKPRKGGAEDGGAALLGDEEFRASREFVRFRGWLRRLLQVTKEKLDQRVEQAKGTSPRIGDPRAPGRRRGGRPTK